MTERYQGLRKSIAGQIEQNKANNDTISQLEQKTMFEEEKPVPVKKSNYASQMMPSKSTISASSQNTDSKFSEDFGEYNPSPIAKKRIKKHIQF